MKRRRLGKTGWDVSAKVGSWACRQDDPPGLKSIYSIIGCCHASLYRVGMDTIDLYQCHVGSPERPEVFVRGSFGSANGSTTRTPSEGVESDVGSAGPFETRRCNVHRRQHEEGAMGTLDRHIEVTPEIVGGKPRIAGHRITVENIVVWHEHQGRAAVQIAEEYDLTLAEVHAALAFYHDHRTEIDRAMELGQEYVEACRRGSDSKVAEKLCQQERDGEAKILHG